MTDSPPEPSLGRPARPTPRAGARAGLGWRALLWGLRFAPQRLASRIVGAAARIPLPHPLRRPLLGGFVKTAGIRMDEAELSLEEYGSFDALFTRALRPGIRSWEPGRDVLASPVDGVIGECGVVSDGQLVQAKGRHYTAGALLADEDAAARYEGGLFMTIYLSPRHYHRIHTPIPGRVVSARHVPGRLFPVHPAAVLEVAHLFARNERLLCTVASDVGEVAVVAVGAMNVGRISAAFDAEWAGGPEEGVTNRGRAEITERRYAEPLEVSLGAQLMTFHLGSTVVLLAPPGLRLESRITTGLEVEVGHTLARPHTPN